MNNIAIVGTGYVGLTTGACFAHKGHNVICVDINEEIVERLNRGEVTFYEPGLEEIIKSASANGKLKFTTKLSEALPQSEAVFIAVPTPSAEDGTVNTSFVEGVAREIGEVGACQRPVGAAASTATTANRRREQPLEGCAQRSGG